MARGRGEGDVIIRNLTLVDDLLIYLYDTFIESFRRR
jgi:hypothetical protein